MGFCEVGWDFGGGGGGLVDTIYRGVKYGVKTDKKSVFGNGTGTVLFAIIEFTVSLNLTRDRSLGFYMVVSFISV